MYFIKGIFFFIGWSILISKLISSSGYRRPNIIIFLADDVGRNDVGFHGSPQIPTPNIDALGYNGVVLNRHYTMHICTPSRTALLTGNFPIRSGMQGWPLAAGEPRAIPINMPTMAEKLLELGYNTHLVGKWHLGHQNRSVTPTGRGFQTHFGYWSGFVGYFDYQIKDKSYDGFDLHRQFRPTFEYNGTYATDLFTEEAINIINHHDQSHPMFLLCSHLAAHTGKNGWALEVPNPEDVQEKYDFIQESGRRLYADIVNRMDTSIGKVVKALEGRGMLENTILVFMSDNGGQSVGFFQNFGSNWPLRGLKQTLYEGGVRNVATIWSKKLKNQNYVENTLFHISDWLPTLYNAAGGNVADLGKIDGINHWPLLTKGHTVKPRRHVLLNIDEQKNFSGILSSDGRYKLTLGTLFNGLYDGYYGDSGRTANTPSYNITSVLHSDVNDAILKAGTASPLTEEIILKIRNKLEVSELDAKRENLTCTPGYCLFNLEKDPTETTDISNEQPDIVIKLVAALEEYRQEMVPQTNTDVDPKSNPAFCNGSWFTWQDPEEKCDSMN